jgi:hypothetical protein
MLNKKTLNGIAVFAAGYAKRWMEGHLYDRVLETKFGQKFKTLDKKAIYGFEFGLNFLTTILDQKFNDDTAIKKFIKEVGMDAASELSKRLINGIKKDMVFHLIKV